MGDGAEQIVLDSLQRTRLSRRRIIWLLGPLSRQQVVFLSQYSCVSPMNLTDGKGGGGGGGAKPYDGERAWSSINYTLLSGANHSFMYVQCSILYRSDGDGIQE